MTKPSAISLAARPTDSNRGPDGRFVPGNQSAKRHGLRAGTKPELRRRDKRVGRLLRQYLEFRADSGRELAPTQLPLARRYCELETLANDLYALVRTDQSNGRALEQYLAVTRTMSVVAHQIGETVVRDKGGKVDLRSTALFRIAEQSRAEERRLFLEASNDA